MKPFCWPVVIVPELVMFLPTPSSASPVTLREPLFTTFPDTPAPAGPSITAETLKDPEFVRLPSIENDPGGLPAPTAPTITNPALEALPLTIIVPETS